MKFPSDDKIPTWDSVYLKEVWYRIGEMKKAGSNVDPDYIALVRAEMQKRGLPL